MIRKFIGIISFFLLLVFILPSIVKFEHHHQYFECSAKNEAHYHELHDKCPVCNFEFSIFSSDFENIALPKKQPLAKYCNNYRSDNYSIYSKYLFLLRAPPGKQV